MQVVYLFMDVPEVHLFMDGSSHRVSEVSRGHIKPEETSCGGIDTEVSPW